MKYDYLSAFNIHCFCPVIARYSDIFVADREFFGIQPLLHVATSLVAIKRQADTICLAGRQRHRHYDVITWCRTGYYYCSPELTGSNSRSCLSVPYSIKQNVIDGCRIAPGLSVCRPMRKKASKLANQQV